jgi:Flp pilus assembly protein TadD
MNIKSLKTITEMTLVKLFRGPGLLAFLLALTVLSVGCTRDPNVLKQKYLASGNAYFEKEKYSEAVIQYRNAIQIDPKFLEAHSRLSQCYLKLGSWNEAYRELNITLDLQPENEQAAINMGALLLVGGKTQEALDLAKSTLEKHPDSADAHVLMANVDVILRDLNAAVNEMLASIRLAPNRSELYLNLGLIQSQAGSKQDAEVSLKKAIELDPKSAHAVATLGDFYLREGRFTDAQPQYEQAINLEPLNPAPRRGLANLYLKQDQKAKAERVLQEAKQAMPNTPAAYGLLADFYLATGELEKALSEYASLIKDHPSDFQVKKNYIELLARNSRFDEASRLNEEVLKKNPRDTQGLILRGLIWIGQGRSSDAVAPLEAATKADPENATAHFLLAQAVASTGDAQRAEAEVRKAVSLNPLLPDAQKALAQIAKSKGDVSELLESSAALMRLQPNSPDGYILHAAALLAHKDQLGAEADLNKAIAVAPQNSSGYTQLGVLRFLQKRNPEAQALFDQALALNPVDVDALQALINIDLQQKQLERALARVQAQISKSPGTSSFYALQGALLAGAKRFDDAEAALLKAVDLDKKNGNALLLLAQVEVMRGSPDKAIANYQSASQRDPRDPRFPFLIGSIEEGRGNAQQAEIYYRKALNLQPDFAAAANNLAYLMLERGENVDVALSLAQTARQRLSDQPSVADTLAWAYYHKGAYKLAIDLLEEATKKDPKSANFQYHLGLAYQKSGDASRARVHLERALQLNPKFEHSVEIRTALSELGKG